MNYSKFPKLKYAIGDRIWLVEKGIHDDLRNTCENCNGKGIFNIKIKTNKSIQLRCDKCFGKGTLQIAYRYIYTVSKPYAITGFQLLTPNGMPSYKYILSDYSKRNIKYNYHKSINAIMEEHLIFTSRKEAQLYAKKLNKNILFTYYKK